jgi:hypothetical protein
MWFGLSTITFSGGLDGPRSPFQGIFPSKLALGDASGQKSLPDQCDIHLPLCHPHSEGKSDQTRPNSPFPRECSREGGVSLLPFPLQSKSKALVVPSPECLWRQHPEANGSDGQCANCEWRPTCSRVPGQAKYCSLSRRQPSQSSLGRIRLGYHE